MSRRSRLIADPYVAPDGGLYCMADPAVHPIGTPVERAAALLYVCHPDDEQRYRDALAIAQEHTL